MVQNRGVLSSMLSVSCFKATVAPAWHVVLAVSISNLACFLHMACAFGSACMFKYSNSVTGTGLTLPAYAVLFGDHRSLV